MKEYHARTRTPERKEILAERSRRWYAKHPQAGRAAMKKWRLNHPEDYRASTKRTVAKVKKVISDAKNQPCADCGKHYPSYVMDFDHVRGVKLFAVSRGYSQGVSAIVGEIKKCEVVCSNCHRERTHQRKQA